VDWIGLAQDRNKWRDLVNSVLNLRVPWNAGKLSSGLTSSGLSGSAQLHREILLSATRGGVVGSGNKPGGRIGSQCHWSFQFMAQGPIQPLTGRSTRNLA
jgi:hypothetical protein